jgi:hypothetical protein
VNQVSHFQWLSSASNRCCEPGHFAGCARLLATNLAQGALVAWQVPQEKLDSAFDYSIQTGPLFRPRRDSLD